MPTNEQRVQDILRRMSRLDDARELFSELNYAPAHDLLPRHDWGEAARTALAEDPQVIAAHDDFQVIYCRLPSDKLHRTPERAVVNRLLQNHPYALFLFSNADHSLWHFLNVKVANAEDMDAAENRNPTRRRLFRRILVGRHERLFTASKRLAMIDLDQVGRELYGIPPLTIQQAHDNAFDVEAVTKDFFDEYEGIFRTLQGDLTKQTGDAAWAHDYALQFLSRLMFLYFVQRKRWLGDEREFLGAFWKAYQTTGQPKDSFFERWLTVLFFEAFNNRKTLLNSPQRAYMPEALRRCLWQAPFLNGGLFKEGELDQRHPAKISDRLFKQAFDLLERYNFTIAEDSPIDQEVAVDPEMIGKVYESLVNVEETSADQRSAAGIFYTPRTEIDLMCRLALVDHLTNHLGQERKNLLYEAVFALEAEEKAAADSALARANLWPALDERLRDLSVADPACGSGSFLVGMLHILDDLQERVATQLGRQEPAYDRRKRIIGQNLYGADVMEWACHVAELRLWLALIVDAEFSREELAARAEPLLPHFTFKIRCGDSLVQEVGGINLRQRRGNLDIPPAIKVRLRRLQKAKLGFYNNEPDAQLRNEPAIRNEEVTIFRDLLDHRAGQLDDAAKRLMRLQAQAKERQITLDGTREPRSQQLTLDRERREGEIGRLMEEKGTVEAVRCQLRSIKEAPFVWDIAFAEVMESDKGGFDIVVGNPPYVSQVNICDPAISPEQATAANKREYKAKLARSVYQAFPGFFGYNRARSTVQRTLDAQSDLYVYFFFHGLSLLNGSGSFSFITSNSWLDVGYGADLQEFLLRNCHVRLILDNQARRSFASAAINTVIVVLSAPQEKPSLLSETARFVTFKVPFEQVVSPVFFEEIEAADQRMSTAEYRLHPITQDALFEAGCQTTAEGDETESEDVRRRHPKSPRPLIKVPQYVGNKWGGKYLRAPDIYWTILKKGEGKFLRLGDIAQVRRGFTTGANEFFYLNEDSARERGIERRFLKPVIKSPRECQTYLINPDDLRQRVFLCREPKSDLRGTGALEYIGWGESQGFDERPTCRGRERWYDLGVGRLPTLFTGKGPWDRHFHCFHLEGLLNDQQIYGACTEVDTLNLCACLNATYTAMFLELAGRSNFGEGILWLATHEVADLPVLNPALVSLSKPFGKLIRRPVQRIVDEVHLSDRRELDGIIFDVLGLTPGERDAVYEAVVSLVETRMKKADSLRPEQQAGR